MLAIILTKSMKRFFTVILISALCATAFAENRPQQLKIMSYNIRGGVGVDNIRDLTRSANVISICDADIVALQEIDSITNRNGKVNVMDSLSALTGMYSTFCKAIDFDGGGYGIGLLSKTKPLSITRVALPGIEERRALIVAEFDNFVFMATHLSLTAEDQSQSLSIMAKIAANCKKPIFVAGDMNFEPKDKQYKEFTELFTILTPQKNTFPANKPNVCIDHIATGRNGSFYARTISSEVINAPVQSDHRPVVATVEFGNIVRTNPYLQNPTNGGLTVCWQTNADAYSYVEFGTDSTNLTKVVPLIEGQAAIGTNNKVRLNGIEKGEKYYYRIVSQHITHYGAYSKSFGGTYKSGFYSFCLPAGDNFTALVLNDLHQRKATFDILMNVVANKNIEYNYIILNGDCVDDPENLDNALSSLSYFNDGLNCSSIPMIYIRGNHEIRGAFSVDFNTLVHYPGGEHCYSAFNIGSTRFVILDSGEDKPDNHPVYYGFNDFDKFRADQALFLKNELASKEFKSAKNRVLIHHIPIYGQSEDEKNVATDYWSNILAKAPFAISVNGHTHSAAKFEKGEVGNNFPILIGGGHQPLMATVIVLKNEDNHISAQCLNSAGQTIFEIK